MTMQATVLQVRRNQLLVFDWETKQQVVVHTPLSCRFRVGGLVCIQYNGVMTLSIPPQISAIRIVSIPRLGLWRGQCRFRPFPAALDGRGGFLSFLLPPGRKIHNIMISCGNPVLDMQKSL